MLKNKHKRIGLIAAIIAIIIISSFLTSSFSVGSKERDFLKTLEEGHSQRDFFPVLIQELTKFDWDIVCTSIGDGLGHYFSSSYANEDAIRRINETRMALAFFKEQELVELLDFRTVERLGEGEQEIVWKGRFKSKYCLNRKEASFSIADKSKELVFQPLSLKRGGND